MLDIDSTGRFFYQSLTGSLRLDMFRSDDGGKTWTPIGGPQCVLELALAPDGSALLVGAYDGAWLATDAGAAWRRLEPFAFEDPPR